MNAVVQLKKSDLPELLAPLGGGFFTGLLMIGDHLFAQVTAPKAEGEITGAWGEYGKLIAGADSFCDGLANTNAMAEAGSEIAKRVRTLRIGGHDDWHIGARDQVELQYRLCKPTTEKNWVFRNGDNPSSVPPGYPYTADLPAQCANPLFQAGGAEAFDDVIHWTSTQSSADTAWNQFFDDGLQYNLLKSYEFAVRPVRLIPVSH